MCYINHSCYDAANDPNNENCIRTALEILKIKDDKLLFSGREGGQLEANLHSNMQ